MNASGGNWAERIAGWCFSILAAVVALYCAVRVLENIWPALVAIVGIAALAAVILRVVVHFTTNNFW